MIDEDTYLILVSAFYRAEMGPAGERYIEHPTERELGCFSLSEKIRITIEDQDYLCGLRKLTAEFHNEKVFISGELVFRKDAEEIDL